MAVHKIKTYQIFIGTNRRETQYYLAGPCEGGAAWASAFC